MIIGVTGTNGSGKGTVVDFLKQKGFRHYSASSLITEEIRRQGLPINRDTMREMGNELRRTHSPSYIVETLYQQAVSAGGNAVIESVREIAGAVFLKEHGAVLLAVDADRRIRYERVVRRASEKDQVSFEEFCEQEDLEMESAASFDMNIRNVMDMADYPVENSGSADELEKKVNEIYSELCQ
jgi:dephospho-CoA kinase